MTFVAFGPFVLVYWSITKTCEMIDKNRCQGPYTFRQFGVNSFLEMVRKCTVVEKILDLNVTYFIPLHTKPDF